MKSRTLLEIAREAAYCLLFSIGVYWSHAADVLMLAGLMLLLVIPSCSPELLGAL